MWSVIVSRVSTGRVERRGFLSMSEAQKNLTRREETQRRTKAGLRGIRVEIAPHNDEWK
jgi:hypothetical protein